ncbi:MAG: flagellar hook capping protein [Nevskiaceae bacterium]|nr:MAG: flagellar hook capping protein [Nevskiaceae bacterium]TBR75138.1 MAG: flagellar hook capping protein [Nevskiaceae bacterium]
MSVNALGSVVGSGVGPAQSTGLKESDFIRLFLTQLTFQDPLNPVDNQQFLAQLAQFTTIQQLQTLSDNIMGELEVQASTQAVGLLGHTVQVTQSGQDVVGTVTTVQFQGGQPTLSLQKSDGTELTDVTPSQITLVR